MAGTREGGLKASQTNRDRYGKEFYHTIGAKGGKKTGLKGFALDPERARTAGALGGKNSKRGQWTPEERQRFEEKRALKRLEAK